MISSSPELARLVNESERMWVELQRRGLIQPTNPFSGAWEFLTQAVYTRDEAAGGVRQFPDYEYLRYVVEARHEHPIFIVEKSRRMLVTWLFCALYLYDILTERHHADYLASRKLETSCELLGRVAFMHEHIPDVIWPDKPPLTLHAGFSGVGYRRIDCPLTQSHIDAVAQGRDQLRQYTATNILCDEFAFWEHAEESWAGLKPTVEGGGHIDLVSTPELGSYMHTLLYS